jgi:tRNA-2-methylthio-N6-dimethylallyladenosine synthase
MAEPTPKTDTTGLQPATGPVSGPVSRPATGGGKKVFVKTFGCQMNVYDSERMAEALAADGAGGGYSETADMADADLIVLNTCHIREKAVEKVYSDLGRIRQIKEERELLGKSTIVTVAGCVAQAEGAEAPRPHRQRAEGWPPRCRNAVPGRGQVRQPARPQHE